MSEKTMNEELDEMANKILANEDKIKSKESHILFYVYEVIFICVVMFGFPITKGLLEKSERIDKKIEYSYKHLPNVVIVFQFDDYMVGVKNMKLFNKPYFTCQSFKFQYFVKEKNSWEYQNGFVVTAELEKLLKDTGVRYQRKDVGYNVGCPKELDEVMTSSFVNW